MLQKQKRYQHWGSNNGTPVVMWTDWFDVPNNCTEEPYQLKGFKGNHLKNEYRTIEV